MCITQGIPHNHTFKNRLDGPKYLGGHLLNIAIGKPAENTSKSLNLTGDWPPIS